MEEPFKFDTPDGGGGGERLGCIVTRETGKNDDNDRDSV